MESLSAYIPLDRLRAMARGEDLPDRTQGAALFADISGFTPLTEMLMKELGPRRGADELTIQLNAVYGAQIAEVHRYEGSVITFSGDAITCWFDGDPSTGSGQAALRATACALAMQQVMGRFARITTPSGKTVPLAIKAAVVAGPARRFLIGDPQIQCIDVLAGATLDRMAEAEKCAARGEVVVGAEVIAQLGGQVEIGEWRGDQRFAVVAGLTGQVEVAVGQDVALPHVSEEQARSWLLPPVYQRLKAGPGSFLAEIRPAVTLFLRFGGPDYDEDEAAGGKLNAYIRSVQAILDRYGSCLLQLTMGDKGSYLYAAFGAPLAHDDDAARAVAAALELRLPPEGMDFISHVQIGLSQGQIWAGAYGSPTRRTYGVLGNEVNIAARLMGKAEPGQMLVSKRVADAAAKSYHFKYLRPLEIKGVKEPLPVFAVLGRRVRAPLFTTLLVGRSDELAQMEKALDSALSGKGQILYLEGEAGTGKSRLAAEFVERGIKRGLQAALGVCQSTSQGIAYFPWRQAFRTLLDLADEPLAGEDLIAWTARQMAQVETTVNNRNPAWLLRLPLLGDLLGLHFPDNATTTAFDSRLRQEALFALAVEMVQTWAQARPLLLFIEDAHWMDEASRGLTLTLGRAIATLPVLLLLVYRPPTGQDKPLLPDLDQLSYHTCLHLHELLPREVAALVTNRLQDKPAALAFSLTKAQAQVRPTALVLSVIQAQAQGNPFFAEELVDTLCESGSLYLRDDGVWTLSEGLFDALRNANCLAQEGGEWVLAPHAQLSAVDLGIPDSVQRLVLSRIDRLAEEHKLTLKVASVIGRIFELELLGQSHPHQPAQEVLLAQTEEMEARDLIRTEMPPPRPTYMFKHNITQEAAYATLLDDQRRELHRAVGQALEHLRPGAVEQLAYHYSRSAMRDKTLFYLDKAARKARHEYANDLALNYYDQALRLEERWEWLKGQAEVLHVLGRRDEERARLESLEAASEAPAFDVAYLWGQYYEALSKYSPAQAAIQRASREATDVMDRVRCLAQLGLIARRQGEYDKAQAWYHQALELLRGQGAYPDEEAQVLNGLGIVYRQQNRFDEATTCLEKALTLSRGSGNRLVEAETLNRMGGTAYYQRDFARALVYHRQALEIRRAIGDRVEEGDSLYNLALITRDAGDYGQAQEHLSAALTIHQVTGNRWEEVNVWNELGILYYQLGDLPRAQACLQQGLKLSQEIGDEVGRAYILSTLGQVVLNQGDPGTAEELLTEGLALAQARDEKHLESYFLSYLALASLQAGRCHQAIQWASESLTERGKEQRLLTADDLATLAAAHLAMDDPDHALNYARQALAILDECGGEGPEFPQRDYFICYQVLSATGQEEAAYAALQSAFNLVITRAGKIADPTLRQSFLEKVPVNREIGREYVRRKT